jgi:hypothetical protein
VILNGGRLDGHTLKETAGGRFAVQVRHSSNQMERTGMDRELALAPTQPPGYVKAAEVPARLKAATQTQAPAPHSGGKKQPAGKKQYGF